MKELFGIPMDTLAVVLAVLRRRLARSARAARRCAIASSQARRPQPRAAGAGAAALIVVGLMLGTTIIAAALATGDTMSHTIRSTAIDALGETDEVVAAKGAADDISGELGAATGTGYFPQSDVDQDRAALGALEPDRRRHRRDRRGRRRPGAVSGRRAERHRSSRPIRRAWAASPRFARGGETSRSRARPRRGLSEQEGRRCAHVRAGDRVLVYVGETRRARMRDVVQLRRRGDGRLRRCCCRSAGAGAARQAGLIEGVLVSNRGDAATASGSRTRSSRR